MGLGDELFNASGSPFKKVAKASALIVAGVAVFDQPLFDNWMMDFVNTETPHRTRVARCFSSLGACISTAGAVILVDWDEQHDLQHDYY